MSDHSSIRARLRAHFATTTTGALDAKWDALWRANFVPWDQGRPSPALEEVLAQWEAEGAHPRCASRRALVPGCGRGYDVLLLAEYGYDAFGVDVSETAVQEARELQVRLEREGGYGSGNGNGNRRGSVSWLVGDFFADGFLNADQGGCEKFDLIYDYTFLSALPPSMRPAWSRRFKDLLAPEGRVICIEFPTYKAHSTGGPPWGLPPQVYEAHLARPGQILPYSEEGLQEDQLDESALARDTLQRILHFQPKRTHAIGYDADGKMTDWVGIWAHPS